MATITGTICDECKVIKTERTDDFLAVSVSARRLGDGSGITEYAEVCGSECALRFAGRVVRDVQEAHRAESL